MHRQQQFIKEVYGKNPSTLDEIAEACVVVISTKQPVLGFSWDVRYNSHTSNTHSRPLDGVENWGGKIGKPTGYPGFSGRVWIRYDNDKHEGWPSEKFYGSLTHTGTGGFGSYNGPWEGISTAAHRTKDINRLYPEPKIYSWDYRFYISDFPAFSDALDELIEQYNKKVSWDLLKGRNRHEDFSLRHHFLWEDQDTKKADEEFLDYVKNAQLLEV